MACSSELVPRQLFPPEMVRFVNSNSTHKNILSYIQDSSASRDSSRDSSPDVDETCNICSCKSMCQQRTCPCKKGGLFCGDRCKYDTRQNLCKNRVSNNFPSYMRYNIWNSLVTNTRRSYSECCCFTGSSAYR